MFRGVWRSRDEGVGGLGGFGEVKRGLLDSYRALFSRLKVLYGTKFGSKQHIMVQMANVYKKNITDPFLDLWSLPKGPQRAIYMSKTSYFRPQIVPIMAFPPLKWSLDGPN